VMFFIMLASITAAIDKLSIPLISDIFAQLIEFGGGILLGGVILTVGYVLASIAQIISSPWPSDLPSVLLPSPLH